MSQDADKLKAFKARMKAVALKNDDEFKTTVTVDEKGYHVEVIETADSHTLLEGHGAVLFVALDDALKNLPGALKTWGYKDSI